jgi:hypothetical protein
MFIYFDLVFKNLFYLIRLQDELFWTRMFNVNRLLHLSEWWTEPNAQKTQLGLMKYVSLSIELNFKSKMKYVFFRILDIIGQQVIGI